MVSETTPISFAVVVVLNKLQTESLSFGSISIIQTFLTRQNSFTVNNCVCRSIKLRKEKNINCKAKFLSNTKANVGLNLSCCLLVRLTVSFVNSETKTLICWLNFCKRYKQSYIRNCTIYINHIYRERCTVVKQHELFSNLSMYFLRRLDNFAVTFNFKTVSNITETQLDSISELTLFSYISFY